MMLLNKHIYHLTKYNRRSFKLIFGENIMTIHSFKEFINEGNILQLDKEVRAFDANKKTMEYDDAVKEVERILTKYQDQMQTASDKFFKLMKGYANRGKADFLYNTKPVTSIISKVVKRGKNFTQLGDLIRGAILFDTQEELDAFVKDFQRKEKTMIKDYEAKEKGGDKTYGYYGSHHFDLIIDGFVIELQAMTKKLWQFKDTAHDIYNKTRETGVITKADMELSKKIFNLGNRPKYIKECIEAGHEWVSVEGTTGLQYNVLGENLHLKNGTESLIEAKEADKKEDEKEDGKPDEKDDKKDDEADDKKKDLKESEQLNEAIDKDVIEKFVITVLDIAVQKSGKSNQEVLNKFKNDKEYAKHVVKKAVEMAKEFEKEISKL